MPGTRMPADDATDSLLRACVSGKPDHRLLEQWILMGANVNTTTAEGNTPLMLIARRGDTRTARFLLARGAKLDQQNPYNGQTALMLAAWAGHAETAVYLYQAGALITAQDSQGKSAHSDAKDPARTALLDADRDRLQAIMHRQTLEKLARIAAQKKPPRL